MTDDAKAALEKAAQDRRRDARAQKTMFEIDIREAYYFTAPQRSRDITSMSTPSNWKPRDASLLNTSLGMEVAQDFATEMLNTCMPSSMQWAEQKPGVDLPHEQWKQLKADVDKQTKAIHDGIKASNFYPAAALSFQPDLAVGTCAMWIDDLRAHEPLVCNPVPIRELEINVGPYGQVDDRFVIRHTKFRHVPALLPGVKLPDEIAKKVKDKANGRCVVTWGFWRIWEDPDIAWQAVILVDNKLVADTVLKGVGSCPLVVGRFNSDPMFAWGTGPSIAALPELRWLDEVRGLHIESADLKVHPPFMYPDDGITNFSGGIEPGKGYPTRPWGAGAPIHTFDFGGDVNFAHFMLNEIEQTIRRMHYVDFPEQVGKTPPTAEQWLDELQRTKKRIGTPLTVFWRELPSEVFLRFKYLLEKRGVIKPIEADGKALSLTPYDPTEVAQKQQEVMVASNLLKMAMQFFPQISQVVIDPIQTLQNMKDGLEDKMVVIRSQDDIQSAMQQFGALAAKSNPEAGGDPAAAGGGGSPSGPAPPPGGAPPPGPGSPAGAPSPPIQPPGPAPAAVRLPKAAGATRPDMRGG